MANPSLLLSRFIGREREIDEIRRLLPEYRLITLSGPGDCGKTRLAIEVAANSAADFEDQVWLVELAAFSDPALVVRAVASALDICEQPGSSLSDWMACRWRLNWPLLACVPSQWSSLRSA